MDTDKVVTVQEAAALLGVHQQTVREALKEGRLTGTKALGRIVLLRVDVDAYKARTQPDGLVVKHRRKGSKNRRPARRPGEGEGDGGVGRGGGS